MALTSPLHLSLSETVNVNVLRPLSVDLENEIRSIPINDINDFYAASFSFLRFGQLQHNRNSFFVDWFLNVAILEFSCLVNEIG